MSLVLAAASTGLFEPVTGIFSRVDTLAHPDNLLTSLKSLSIVWAAIFVAAGLVCLLHGYRFYRTVTLIMALAIGGFAGYVLGKHIRAEEIVAGCLAALLAVCCWPLMKYAVALMGGLVGAFIGANTWSAVMAVMNTASNAAPRPDAAQNTYWVGALVGLLVCGMLAFILFKLSVVLFTSVSGATLALLGVIALLLQVPAWEGSIRGTLAGNAMVLPLLVIVPAIIGLILQQAQPEKGAGGGGGGAPKAAKAAA